MPRHAAVAFDMIGTVFSTDGLGRRLEAAGLPASALELWLARTLRDGFALAASESFQPFRVVASAALDTVFTTHERPIDRKAADRILDGFGALQAYEDAEPAFRQLQNAGLRILALTNGEAETADALLRGAGLREMVERIVSIEEIGAWKPRREVYLRAAAAAGIEPHELALVAAHGWDVHGAARAGLGTGFVMRAKRFPASMQPPDVAGHTLVEVVERLLELKARE